jgi:hypothetical protein
MQGDAFYATQPKVLSARKPPERELKSDTSGVLIGSGWSSVGVMMVRDMEGLEQDSCGAGDILDSLIKDNLVGSRGRIEAADLPDELQGSVMQFLIRRMMSGISQALDVTAHVTSSVLAMNQLERAAYQGKSRVLMNRGQCAG